MQKYKITIKELVIQEIRQGKRTIKRKHFIKIKDIPNIDISDLSKKVIELKSRYRDFKYIIDFERM
jgi:hypothetical protein